MWCTSKGSLDGAVSSGKVSPEMVIYVSCKHETEIIKTFLTILNLKKKKKIR